MPNALTGGTTSGNVCRIAYAYALKVPLKSYCWEWCLQAPSCSSSLPARHIYTEDAVSVSRAQTSHSQLLYPSASDMPELQSTTQWSFPRKKSMAQLRDPQVRGMGAGTQYIEVDYSRHVRVPPPAMLARRQDEDMNSFTRCRST